VEELLATLVAPVQTIPPTTTTTHHDHDHCHSHHHDHDHDHEGNNSDMENTDKEEVITTNVMDTL
jgi:hypothetical protein